MNSRYLELVRLPAAAVLAAALLSACGGGGGGGGGGQQPPANVTISGQITFDRIPFDTVLGDGLNPAATAPSPARQVTVQAIAEPGGAVLASGTTDTTGNYSLSVASNTNLRIRARAEMIKTGAAPTWSFSVRNNANSDALYALDGDAASSGTANSIRNLNAPSGFGTTSYTGVRAAAPFAILDTVFRAKELVLSATPGTEFPALSLFWSDENRPTVARFCPDDGDIGTSSYIVFAPGEVDQCTVPQTNPDGIYILGNFTATGGDTDEFDQSVIAHEFGHYVEDRFGRSDSIGGDHGNDIPLDLRVAFGEGWGNAFSGMVLGGPVYRDSFDGMQADFSIDMEADGQAADGFNEGWFSEISVGEILWDLFDSTTNEPSDNVALGFPPLFAVMTGAEVTTDALTSIFTFSNGLRAAQPGSVAAINALLTGEDIFITDDIGTGEMNDGDPVGNSGVLPVYREISLTSGPLSVCSRSPFGKVSSNKLGNRVFLRFNNDQVRLVTITATGAVGDVGTVAATDPDMFVLRRGALAAFGAGTGATETISQVSLPAGLYIIEVYDFDIDQPVGAGPQPRCMTVSVTG